MGHIILKMEKLKRAFVDGRFYDGINHEEAFKKTKCPIMLIHADWKRYENLKNKSNRYETKNRITNKSYFNTLDDKAINQLDEIELIMEERGR